MERARARHSSSALQELSWRQGRRTRLTDETASALFILDALDPMTDEQLLAAADDLLAHLREADPDLVVAQRLIAAG